MAVPEHHIREAVARYVAGEVTLDEFRDWFIPRAWEAIEEAGSTAAELASDIELFLAEFSNGDWDEHELRDLLKQRAAIPEGRLVEIDSPFGVSVTGGPLQNTIVVFRDMFLDSGWIQGTKHAVEEAA